MPKIIPVPPDPLLSLARIARSAFLLLTALDNGHAWEAMTLRKQLRADFEAHIAQGFKLKVDLDAIALFTLHDLSDTLDL